MAGYHRILALSANDDCYGDDCAANPPPPTHLGESQGRRLTNFIIIATATFAASILLTFIYYAVLRRRRRLPATALPLVQDDASSLGDGEPLHHVWYIRTVGLDESTIASIAVVEYRAGDGLLDGVSDCSVCLAQFRDGERVRLLPKCGHAFHAPCIDTWLRAHINCPLCRAHIVDPEAEPALPEATDAGRRFNAAGESVEMDTDSSASVEATQIGIRVIRPPEEAGQNRGPESTTETGIQINSSQVFVPLPDSPLSGEQSDLNGRGLHPVRRSLSMDTPLTNPTIVRAEAGESAIAKDEKDAIFEQESILKNMRRLGSSSKGVLNPKAHPDVGRSLSSSGRGFIFSRQGRVARMHSMPK